MTRVLRYLMPAAVILSALLGLFSLVPTASAQAAPGQAQELAFVEVTGVIDGLSETTMLVGWWEVDTSGAELNVALELDVLVKVEGYLLSDGVVWALEVNALETEDVPGTTELTGTLTAFDETTAEVSGLLFDVTGAEIEASVVADELVKVHAVQDETGALIAWEINLADPDENGGPINLPEDCVPALPSGWVIYTIQSGDTLSEIADATDSSVQELANINCISDPRLSVEGQVLFVPVMPNFDDEGNTNDNDDGENENESEDDNDNDGSNANDNGNSNDDDDGNGNDDDGSNSNDDDDDNDNNDNDDDDDDEEDNDND